MTEDLTCSDKEGADRIALEEFKLSTEQYSIERGEDGGYRIKISDEDRYIAHKEYMNLLRSRGIRTAGM